MYNLINMTFPLKVRYKILKLIDRYDLKEITGKLPQDNTCSELALYK